MPLRSKAQQRYLFATNPALAKEFAAKTPNLKGLPEHATKKTPTRKPRRKSSS